jgi:S-DNA-T family DNA segregation ATPase FtsK/SpoIIIE
MPSAIAGLAARKLALRLADAYDYTLLGATARDARRWPPGRAFDVVSGLDVQLALPPALPSPTATDGPMEGPDRIEVLPARVDVADLALPSFAAGPDLVIPIGLVDRPRDTARLEASPREVLLLAGPDGSGRTNACAAVVVALAGAESPPAIIVTGPPRSPLRERAPGVAGWNDPSQLTAAVARLRESRPVVVVVDDADLIDDRDGSIASMLDDQSTPLYVVAAAHPERLRLRYDHWLRSRVSTRCGLALRPTPLDGELWATTFPAERSDSWPVGRGYLVQRGRAHLVQVAHA